MFGRVKQGKRHLVLALRVLFNFYETIGVEKRYLDALRKALPKTRSGIDLKIPSEARIVKSLRELPNAPLKYQALYNLLLDSGLRLTEAVSLINDFEGAERVNGFHRCELAMFRGEKQAYYGHFTQRTLELIEQVKEVVSYKASCRYYRKDGLCSS